MKQTGLIFVVDNSGDNFFNLEQVCDHFGISSDFIQELINYGIIQQRGSVSSQLLFDLEHLHRIKVAIRLHHDLEINFAGIALVLELLDEMQDLRSKAAFLEKHFLRF